MVDALAKAPTALVAMLEQLGWTLQVLEADEHIACAQLKRADGRLVTLYSHHGRLSLTREQEEVVTVAVGRKGDLTRVDRVQYRLLGRERFQTPEGAFRALSEYLVDNGNGHQLPPDALKLLLSP